MLTATEPGWSAADYDFADDVEACGVKCCACGEWVYATSAEYDDLEQEWICDDCLYGRNDEDDEDEGEVMA